jgi:uncharacterized protein YndB with AHSA1/START domain
MNNNLLFDFIIDKPNKAVTVVREFAADPDMVWDAFTRAELLDQWWAPKPFASKTKHMNFVVGGKRFYAMVSPEGAERWALQTYQSITPKSNFRFYNAFADENENPQLPGSEWDFSFSEQDGKTKVTIYITNESRERYEMILASGFMEGYKMTMQLLEELLERLKKQG